FLLLILVFYLYLLIFLLVSLLLYFFLLSSFLSSPVHLCLFFPWSFAVSLPPFPLLERVRWVLPHPSSILFPCHCYLYSSFLIYPSLSSSLLSFSLVSFPLLLLLLSPLFPPL